ncbi:Prepilin-type N-terminal cleavage/methylation domain protein [Candidatus Accumulibacter aalborgensis]|uniref:Prepilin-type N-terminal cleavage/methylation domain protein n=1 Tax=Candidatus Accumulibacter aalborgensis TaxID=1860102 RepID=A0A1A8XW44_9PROT|nr:prepilin-type cleavage/methylation domain-containing protein [Candidatus Accumulibacter aalborgensis]SBT08218.1 Prepilin-type N-terminal cleavage/methylation domain protein [Candidatus Accumulibacter aalborgensis]
MPSFTLPLNSSGKQGAGTPCGGGFSLVEMAIVLLIVGLLLGGLLLPLSAQIDQRNYNETQQQISEIRDALIGFAVVNRRLPRPATSATNGAENPALCPAAGCTGLIPWATLGVKKTDAWNHIIRYSVTPAYANAPFTLTTNGSLKVKTRDSAGITSYLIGSDSSCSASPCAPAVIYSTGKNNWGITEDGTALADGSSTNVDEDLNANPQANAFSTPVFFSRNPSTVPVGGEFDDIVVWIPPYLLMNRMISAGQLP